MNQENLDYLKNNLKYAGFGEQLYGELEKKIQKGVPEFTLKMDSEFNKQRLESTLHFRKSDTTDMYFFNKHDAYLHHATDPTKDVQQTFYMNMGKGITAKEAFNLLEGRAVNTDLVNKEGQKYNAWVQLDFSEKETGGNFKMKQFHQNYGYDLAATLEKYPIKELMDSDQRSRLIASLEKGNVQMVTMDLGGKEEKMFIAANPQFKTMNVFDVQMRPLQKESLRAKIGEEKGLSVSQKNGTEIGEKNGVKTVQNNEAGIKNGASEKKGAKIAAVAEPGEENKQGQKKSLKGSEDSGDDVSAEKPKRKRRMRQSH